LKFPVAGLAAAGLIGAATSAFAAQAAPAASAVTPAAAPKAVQKAAPAGDSALSPMLKLLEIGNPLPALSDCADKRTPDGRDVTAFCVELKGDGIMRQVGIPRDKRPAFMDGVHVVAFVDGNALVGVIVPTAGANSQQAALDSVNALYGKPFRQEQEDMRDKAGNPVKTIHAGWMHKPLTVELYAMPEDPNTGTIEMLLPRARALMADKDAQVAQQLAPASAPAAAPSKEKKPAPKPVKPGSW
jgi:hypothetical protein